MVPSLQLSITLVLKLNLKHKKTPFNPTWLARRFIVWLCHNVWKHLLKKSFIKNNPSHMV